MIKDFNKKYKLIKTRKFLSRIFQIEVCVTVMFTCSAQHAAVNFGQFETYKFVPNSPGCMRKLPPKNDSSFTVNIFL